MTGSDFAGTIWRCGPRQEADGGSPAERTALQVGDAVMGLAAGCIGSSVLAEVAVLARLAPGVTTAAAAALPTVVVTAEAAFALAGLRRGMR